MNAKVSEELLEYYFLQLYQTLQIYAREQKPLLLRQQNENCSDTVQKMTTIARAQKAQKMLNNPTSENQLGWKEGIVTTEITEKSDNWMKKHWLKIDLKIKHRKPEDIYKHN